MEKERWEEILREEGYPQLVIDSLWAGKPDFMGIDDLTEEVHRTVAQEMKDEYPDWAMEKEN